MKFSGFSAPSFRSEKPFPSPKCEEFASAGKNSIALHVTMGNTRYSVKSACWVSETQGCLEKNEKNRQESQEESVPAGTGEEEDPAGQGQSGREEGAEAHK